MIRAFVAVEMPAPVLEALQQVAAAWAAGWPADAVRWTPAANLHLTLRFLGDTEPDLVPRVARGLDQVAAAVPSFAVRLDRAGAFPNMRRPRVLWAGLEDGDQRLAALKKAVDRALRPLGWDRDEQRFSPHLTLGRLRAPERAPGAAAPPPVPALAVPVDGIALVESHLKPAGAEYAVLHRAVLTGSEPPSPKES